MKKIMILLLASTQLLYSMEENNGIKRKREESEQAEKRLSPVNKKTKESEQEREKRVYATLGVSLPVATVLCNKAARDGNINFLESALKAGVNPNDSNKGVVPLLYAARNGNMKIAKLLIHYGASVEGSGEDTVIRPLLAAALQKQWRMMKFLFDQGAIIDNNFLKFAARGHPEIRQLIALKNSGEDRSMQDGAPLQLFTQLMREKINQYEAERFQIKEHQLEQITALEEGMQNGTILLHDRKNTSLVKKRAQEYLISSCVVGCEEAFTLLRAGINPNIADEFERTPLIYACANNNIPLAEMLIRYNAHVNARDGHGWTPLIWAASHGYQELTKLLINNGADVNAVDQRGASALLYTRAYNHSAVTLLLIENGAVSPGMQKKPFEIIY